MGRDILLTSQIQQADTFKKQVLEFEPGLGDAAFVDHLKFLVWAVDFIVVNRLGPHTKRVDRWRDKQRTDIARHAMYACGQIAAHVAATNELAATNLFLMEDAMQEKLEATELLATWRRAHASIKCLQAQAYARLGTPQHGRITLRSFAVLDIIRHHGPISAEGIAERLRRDHTINVQPDTIRDVNIAELRTIYDIPDDGDGYHYGGMFGTAD